MIAVEKGGTLTIEPFFDGLDTSKNAVDLLQCVRVCVGVRVGYIICH